ncbi:MAG: PilW family protein [Burkholderia sp.]
MVNRYFVRASSVTDEPELYCEGSGRNGTAQPLVEGIERLRVRYRLRDRSTWDEASAVVGEAWQRVQAVEVCVQARGAAGSAMRRYTDCDGLSQPIHDGRARWILRRWLAVRNAVFAEEGGG